MRTVTTHGLHADAGEVRMLIARIASHHKSSNSSLQSDAGSSPMP